MLLKMFCSICSEHFEQKILSWAFWAEHFLLNKLFCSKFSVLNVLNILSRTFWAEHFELNVLSWTFWAEQFELNILSWTFWEEQVKSCKVSTHCHFKNFSFFHKVTVKLYFSLVQKTEFPGMHFREKTIFSLKMPKFPTFERIFLSGNTVSFRP